MKLCYRDIDKHIAQEAETVAAIRNGGIADGWQTMLLLYVAWLIVGALVLLTMNRVLFRLPGLPVRAEVSAIFAVVWMVGMTLHLFWGVPRAKTVRASALRTLAAAPERVTPLEAEYCRTVAELLEQKALSDITTQEVVAALNTLLLNGRLLEGRLKEMQTLLAVRDAPSLSAEAKRLETLLLNETDEAHRATLEQLIRLNETRQSNEATLAQNEQRLRLRQEVILQTFLSLRGTLHRTRLAHQHVIGESSTLAGTSGTEVPMQNLQEIVAQLQLQASNVERATGELLAARG